MLKEEKMQLPKRDKIDDPIPFLPPAPLGQRKLFDGQAHVKACLKHCLDQQVELKVTLLVHLLVT